MQADQPVLDKIRKLLQVDPAKGATQAEAEQALMAAQRLALKHSIDLAAVDVTGDTTAGEPIVNQPWTPQREGGGECAARLPTCHKFIAWILGKYFGVRVIEVSSWGEYVDKGQTLQGRRKSLSLVGRQSNVQIAIYVYGYLHREFMDLWHAHKKKHGLSMADRNGFFYGLYVGLSEKLEREKGVVEADVQAELGDASTGKSVALMLVGETEKVEQHVKEAHPRLKYTTVGAGPVNDYGVLYAGKSAGKQIEIKTALK
jgi:hypothetical protein